MLKNILRTASQKLIGFENYLFFFSLINIARIRVGGYEKEFKHFLGLIPENGIILDIGANIGIMTVLFAKTSPKTTIYAVEPIPQNRQALKRVITHFQLKNVEVINTALGDRNGNISMIMPRVNHANMQGLCHVIEADRKEMAGEICEVLMQKMDDIPILKNLDRIDAIKIDVENYEYFVLKGGQTLLAKHRPLMYCELWNDERRKLCIEFMQNLGYQVMIYKKGELIKYNGQEITNFFFLPCVV